MNNIALQLGPIQIHWYGILIALAFLIGYWLTRKNAKHYGISPEVTDSLLVKLIIVIIVGARLAFVISKYPFFIANPWEIIRLDHGGLGSQGAIIAAMVFGYFWTKKAKISYWKLADATAPGITIGHIFVRIGNFINGELYGPPTNLPWGVKFPSTSVPVHPSQLYEVITSFIVLPFAIKWSQKPRYPGYAFLRVLLVHSIIRFFMDFFRQNTSFNGHLVLTQIMAIILAVASFSYIFYLEAFKYKN
ncbi:MAG TPA: prolipoprotein diacylglyceryl transferase [Firmicutes bacterium]|jgi:phosphatidylglycerol---prolipoprotein diacylglyceryl transferase|nr:prolipoprotein diacylglyceryl transferase [Bacillota bacterium]